MGRSQQALEKAHLMLDRAEQVRRIADGLSQDDHRSFLHTIADDLERRAKQIACRAQRNLTTEHQRQGYLPVISRCSGSGVSP